MTHPPAPLSDPPFFHPASESVRFWVQVGDEWIGASVSQQALRHRYQPNPPPGVQAEDPLTTYLAHVPEMEAAVRRRVALGSREPVMLREFDLRAPSA